MDSFSSFFKSQSPSHIGWSYDSVKNFRQISPVVQAHLKLVYDLLRRVLLLLFYGAYFHLTWNIGGIITTIGCIGMFLWLLFKPQYPLRKKVALFMVAVFFEGASIVPVMKLVVEVDPLLLLNALFGSMLVSGCFSLAALLTRRREYLYLGGVLSSGVSTLMLLKLVPSICDDSTAIFKFELLFGLVLFVSYMFVVTQVIIEKAHRGDMDYVQHTLMFFIPDVVAVFVQILKILTRYELRVDDDFCDLEKLTRQVRQEERRD